MESGIRPPSRVTPPSTLQLLRSAVSLQAEGLLRTAGALSGVWGNVLDRTAWIERDARDLSALTTAAVAAGASLPAGLDSGAGDPDHPSSVVEGLLASHEALVRVLREIAGPASTDQDVAHRHVPGSVRDGLDDPDTAGGATLHSADSVPGSDLPGGDLPDGDLPAAGPLHGTADGTVAPEPEAWRRLVRGVLDRREEEIVLLRAVGAAGQLPAEQAYRRGRPPRH